MLALPSVLASSESGQKTPGVIKHEPSVPLPEHGVLPADDLVSYQYDHSESFLGGNQAASKRELLDYCVKLTEKNHWYGTSCINKLSHLDKDTTYNANGLAVCFDIMGQNYSSALNCLKHIKNVDYYSSGSINFCSRMADENIWYGESCLKEVANKTYDQSYLDVCAKLIRKNYSGAFSCLVGLKGILK